MTGSGIVVGYDGSAGAEDALAWAAREARSRGLVLTVCLALSSAYPDVPRTAEGDREWRRAAEEALAAGVHQARTLMPDGGVWSILVNGPPAAALCEQSADADMVVVGSRGRGGMAGLPIGSVTLKVAAEGRGPVVVVRGTWQRVADHAPLPVVVGTDGSPESAPAVAFAFEEAALRDTYVLAVCALADDPARLGTVGRIRNDFEELITRQQDDHPGVSVRRQVSEGSARAALREAGVEAQMLVVGARGRGGIEGLPLGSVGLAVLAYATSPVAIVHPPIQP
jgi:nucleotide-binding universal stress UspA family protein